MMLMSVDHVTIKIMSALDIHTHYALCVQTFTVPCECVVKKDLTLTQVPRGKATLLLSLQMKRDCHMLAFLSLANLRGERSRIDARSPLLLLLETRREIVTWWCRMPSLMMIVMYLMMIVIFGTT